MPCKIIEVKTFPGEFMSSSKLVAIAKSFVDGKKMGIKTIISLIKIEVMKHVLAFSEKKFRRVFMAQLYNDALFYGVPSVYDTDISHIRNGLRCGIPPCTYKCSPNQILLHFGSLPKGFVIDFLN